jgi:hypothetical protein
MASITIAMAARRRELLNQVRLFFRNISPGGSNSTAHLLGFFCCYTNLLLHQGVCPINGGTSPQNWRLCPLSKHGIEPIDCHLGARSPTAR